MWTVARAWAEAGVLPVEEPDNHRDRNKARTREAIMAAVARRLESDGLSQLSFTDIANEADVGESTVYRYFPNKDALLEAFWAWVPQAIQRNSFPRTEQELQARLTPDFVRFDQREALIPGMLASPQGRAARMRTAAERQVAFRELIANEVGVMPDQERDRLLRPVHAHVNLLGWVSLALFGLFYTIYPNAAGNRIARLQFWGYHLPLPVQMLTLGLFVRGNPAVTPILGIASLVVAAGVACFVVNVWRYAGSARA